MRKRWMTLALLALSTGASALQEIEVADGRTVTAKVSARELTRVGMADGRRIVRVWGLEERMTVEPDKEGGQVFIRPTQVPTPRPFSFFVRDDAGATYTVVAVPVDMPADAIVLKAQSMSESQPGTAHPFVAELKSLIRAMALEREPDGYTLTVVNRAVPLWNEARLVLLRRYEGDRIGEVYRLTNTSGAEMRIDERELGVLAEDIEAVALERHVLQPGESTAVYLVREQR